MRFWVGVTSAFGAGTLIGIGIGKLLLEDKMKKEYEESVGAMRRVLLARKIDAETPVFTEAELDEPLPIVIQPRGEGVSLEGGKIELRGVDLPLETVLKLSDASASVPVNPYHKAVVEKGFVSFAELDEEDYFDEGDGREKEQITMVYSEDRPHFFQGNEEIEDWMDRVGGTIVDDMRKAVGDGNPVLYIRNNQTDVDYEVIFEQP
jgi:hypothetical protein